MYVTHSHVQKGFTLIELLAVMAIIAVLATIVMGNISQSRSAGRDAKRVSDIKNIQFALRLYYNDFGYYPDTLTSATFVGKYIPKLPVDPSATAGCASANDAGCYFYDAYRKDGGQTCSVTPNYNTTFPRTKYHLGAAMEIGSDRNSNLREDTDWADDTSVDICSNEADGNGHWRNGFAGQAASTGCVEAFLTIDSNGYTVASNNVTPQNNAATVEYCYDVTN